MGNLSKLTCSILMIAGLSGAAFGAEADTERGKPLPRPPPPARTISLISLPPQS